MKHNTLIRMLALLLCLFTLLGTVACGNADGDNIAFFYHIIIVARTARIAQKSFKPNHKILLKQIFRYYFIKKH